MEVTRGDQISEAQGKMDAEGGCLAGRPAADQGSDLDVTPCFKRDECCWGLMNSALASNEYPENFTADTGDDILPSADGGKNGISSEHLVSLFVLIEFEAV